jgi:hypothetical protein
MVIPGTLDADYEQNLHLRGNQVMRTGCAVSAGLAGAVAYLFAQEVDRRVGDPRANDLVLIGGMFTRQRRAGLTIGLILHLLGGVSLGLVFERGAAQRLWGPYWLRGIVMVQIESASLWPICILLDRFHPLIRSGELAPLTTPAGFLQQAWRHLALGAVIGVLLGPPSRRDASWLPEATT